MPIYEIEKDGKVYEVDAPDPQTAAKAFGGGTGSRRGKRLGKGKGEGIDLQDVRGFGQSLLNGQLAGWGDEFAGASRAVMDNLWETDAEEIAREMVGGKKRGFLEGVGEDYAMYRDDARASQDEFRDENAGIALSAELLGGIASPINKIAPGVGTTGSRVSRAGASGLRGAVEGAVAGLGEGRGTLEEQLNSAKTGAMWGGGIGTALPLAGGVAGDLISSRKVKQNLVNEARDTAGNLVQGPAAPVRSRVTGERSLPKTLWDAEQRKMVANPGITRQMPVHLADREGLMGDFYRNTVGRAWGGKQALAEQEKPFVETADNAIDVAEERIKRVTQATDDEIAGARNARKQAGKDAQEETRRRVRGLESTLNRNVDETIQVVDDDLTKLQRKMAEESLPDNYRVETLSPVDLDNPVEVSEAVGKFWSSKGKAFEIVKKGGPFKWNTSVLSDISREFEADPNLIAEMDKLPGVVRNLVKKFGIADSDSLEEIMGKFGKSGSGTELTAGINRNPEVMIDGEALMELRNFFAKRASKGGDKARGYRIIKDKFDAMIESNLLERGGEEAVEGYKDQLRRYANFLAFRGASDSAPLGQKFTLAQAEKAAKRVGRSSSTGDTPFFDDIAAANARKAEADKLINEADAKVSRRKVRLKDRQIAANNRAERQLNKAIEEQDKRGTTDLARAAKSRASDARSELRSSQVPTNTSGWSSILSTGLLGLPFVGGGLVGALPAGMAVAKGLSTEGAQRAMAGQTGWQQALQQALEEGDTALATRILARYGSQQGTQEQ